MRAARRGGLRGAEPRIQGRSSFGLHMQSQLGAAPQHILQRHRPFGGDKVAQLRLEQARAQLEQQRKAVQQAEANVNQAIANLRQTQARLGIKDGETFNIESFSQVKSVRAQLELAEKELRRTERLLETGDVSRAAYDQRRAQRDQLLGQLDEARSNAAVATRAVNSAQVSAFAARH